MFAHLRVDLLRRRVVERLLACGLHPSSVSCSVINGSIEAIDGSIVVIDGSIGVIDASIGAIDDSIGAINGFIDGVDATGRPSV